MANATLRKIQPAEPGTPKALFGDLFDAFLKRGIRPPGAGRGLGRWKRAAFAEASGVGSVRSVDYYCSGAQVPPADVFARILKALFGDHLSADRTELITAYDKAVGVEWMPPPLRLLDEPPTYFLGREEDLRKVRETMLSCEGSVAILVQGVGGIGKTTLTKAVAHDPAVVERFGDRRWFAALETANTSEQMKDAIVVALGGDRTEGLAKTLDRTGQMPGLLILDNLETPWAPKGERHKTEAVLGMLAKVPSLALLASFRGEESISRPHWALVHPINKLDLDASEELFCGVSRWSNRADLTFKEFVADLDGLPLAIELVAHRAYMTPDLGPIWARWRQLGARFAANPDLEPDHLTSLAASIELSLESPRLSAGALRLFSLLGRLPGGLADIDQAALVGERAYDGAKDLRRTGLAVGDASRINLLSPVRRYAELERPPSATDEDACFAHFLKLVQVKGAAIDSIDGYGALDRLLPEFANIETSILRSLERQPLDNVLTALSGFSSFTYIASLPSIALHELVIACRKAGHIIDEAYCIRTLGDLALCRSEYNAAREAYGEALTLYREIGDLVGQANCIFSVGDIALRRSDHNAAREAYEEALILYQGMGHLLGEANCILSLGEIALRRSEHQAARKAYNEAMPLYHNVGSLLGQANCIKGLGDIALVRWDHNAARKAYEAALPLYQIIGAPLGQANCIRGLGNIAFDRSDHNAACDAYEEALPLYQRIGDLLGEANCIRGLGNIAFDRSDHNAAREAYEEALPLYQKIGDLLGEANCIKKLEDLKKE